MYLASSMGLFSEDLWNCYYIFLVLDATDYKMHPKKLKVVVSTCNPSTWRAEAGGLQVAT